MEILEFRGWAPNPEIYFSSLSNMSRSLKNKHNEFLVNIYYHHLNRLYSWCPTSLCGSNMTLYVLSNDKRLPKKPPIRAHAESLIESSRPPHFSLTTETSRRVCECVAELCTSGSQIQSIFVDIHHQFLGRYKGSRSLTLDFSQSSGVFFFWLSGDP